MSTRSRTRGRTRSPGPPSVGGSAELIELGHSAAVLWLTLLLLILLLVVLRSVSASCRCWSSAACCTSSRLLLSGMRVVFDDGISAADAGNLANLTHIRPGCWVWLWLIGSVLALAVGGSLLV
jgi:hypothetical protein